MRSVPHSRIIRGARDGSASAPSNGRIHRTLGHMSAFVGRVDELVRLGGVVHAAERGEVATAIVVGDPGSGKSRLLAEAAARAAPPTQFRVVGYEPESEVPLASAAALLRALANVTPHGPGLEALVFGADKDASPLE